MKPLTDGQKQIVEENIRLATWIGRRVARANPEVEWEEIRSLACLGLCRAALFYRPEVGTKFSTYAHKVILQVITKELSKRKQIAHSGMASDMSHVPCPHLEMVDIGDEAEKFLKRLPPKAKRYAIGRFFEGKKWTEVAEEYGVCGKCPSTVFNEFARRFRAEEKNREGRQ